MPLIRIDVRRGRTPEALTAIADTIYDVTREVFAAPEGDRYQVIHQHDEDEMWIADTGLELDRSSGILVVQITQQGRTRTQKQALYALMAQRLHERGLVHPDDLVISVLTNDREDWSFGRGRAQFLTGEL